MISPFALNHIQQLMGGGSGHVPVTFGHPGGPRFNGPMPGPIGHPIGIHPITGHPIFGPPAGFGPPMGGQPPIFTGGGPYQGIPGTPGYGYTPPPGGAYPAAQPMGMR